MILGVRGAAKLSLRSLLRLAPTTWAASAARRFPRLMSCLPPGRDHVVAGYLGRYRVAVDVKFPIERAMFAGSYEPELLGLIRRLVPAASWCLDVGANVGAVALALADQVGSSGRVFAFEPGPFLFERLAANVRRNPELERVLTLVNRGVSDQSGKLFWNEDANNPGNAGLLQSSGTRIEVVVLDDYFSQNPIPRLDFVKIDVEGMELEVLRGGRETWRRHQPVLYFETLREFEAIRGFPVFAHIERFLAEIGYTLYRPDVAAGLVPTTAANLGPNTAALPAA
jgi:FkbM family methyltransferase